MNRKKNNCEYILKTFICVGDETLCGFVEYGKHFVSCINLGKSTKTKHLNGAYECECKEAKNDALNRARESIEKEIERRKE